MGKQSDAKRRAKLKERRKRAEAAVSRVSSQDRDAQESMAAFDAGPYVVVSLLDDAGGTIAHVEGNAAGEDWTVVVDQAAVAGSDDEFVALAFLLGVAADRNTSGQLLQFSPWMVEEIDRRCEASGQSYVEYLQSLLPSEKRGLPLPPAGMM